MLGIRNLWETHCSKFVHPQGPGLIHLGSEQKIVFICSKCLACIEQGTTWKAMVTAILGYLNFVASLETWLVKLWCHTNFTTFILWKTLLCTGQIPISPNFPALCWTNPAFFLGKYLFSTRVSPQLRLQCNEHQYTRGSLSEFMWKSVRFRPSVR